MRGIALLCLTWASQALGQEAPLNAAEFEAYTTGKTLSYATPGRDPYGAEEYLPNRRVRWVFTGQECKEGEWYPSDELICFLYDDSNTPQCWSFYLTPRGLRAQFENRPDSAPLYQIDESTEPLFCPGPLIGV